MQLFLPAKQLLQLLLEITLELSLRFGLESCQPAARFKLRSRHFYGRCSWQSANVGSMSSSKGIQSLVLMHSPPPLALRTGPSALLQIIFMFQLVFSVLVPFFGLIDSVTLLPTQQLSLLLVLIPLTFLIPKTFPLLCQQLVRRIPPFVSRLCFNEMQIVNKNKNKKKKGKTPLPLPKSSPLSPLNQTPIPHSHPKSPYFLLLLSISTNHPNQTLSKSLSQVLTPHFATHI